MASGFKYGIVSGVKVVAAAGTAERLVSASSEATRLSIVTFQALDTHGIIIGDSGVVFATGSTQNGLMVSDGTLNAGLFPQVTLDLGSALNPGLKGVHGSPFIDLYNIWVDAETNDDRVFWFGLRASV